MGRASRAKRTPAQVLPPGINVRVHPKGCSCRGCQVRRAASKVAMFVLLSIGGLIGVAVGYILRGLLHG